ncbi:MAG TPA: DM13 domain-containing protein [Nitrososphaeraceae archaeon]|nr:DM13 domain-containing protein [Nitrososphaeraceae archaeon]
MRIKWIIGLIVIVGIAIGFYTLSPLFINKEVEEQIPDNLAIDAYYKFQSLDDVERSNIASEMTDREKNILMIGAKETNKEINEEMSKFMDNLSFTRNLEGTFIGVGDGIHNVDGIAKILTLVDGSKVLRLENFKSTNGPDLHVYLSTDKMASNFMDLGRLKGNIGNQNYQVPDDTDLSKYNNVLIWCKAFSVLFGNAQLF